MYLIQKYQRVIGSAVLGSIVKQDLKGTLLKILLECQTDSQGEKRKNDREKNNKNK